MRFCPPEQIRYIIWRKINSEITRSGNHEMTNPKTTEFVIRMFADQIAEGTFFSMVDLNDSTLNTAGNLESYFADVFYDSIQDSFGAQVGSVMDDESFAEHMASVMFERIDMEKFIDEVQTRVTMMLVQKARENSSEGSED